MITIPTAGGNFNVSSFSEEEYEQMRCEWENQREGKEEGEWCPICKNKGYIRYRENGVSKSKECECMPKRRSLRRIQRSGLADTIEKYTFDSYTTKNDWQRKAKEMALDYLENGDNKWFVASGMAGAGKTHICTAICGEIMNRGTEVRYMLWRDEGNELKASVTDSDKYQKMIEPLKTIPVLYIDDFFKSGARDNKVKVTEGDINLAFEILNARYNKNGLKTIISTELSIEQIMDIDTGVGSRIYQMSKNYYLRFNGKDKNWRVVGDL